MDNYNKDTDIFPAHAVENLGTQTMSKTFMAGVFLWMFAGLGIAAITAGYLSTSDEMLRIIFNPNGGMNKIGWVVIFAPLGLSMLFNYGATRFPVPVIVTLFLAQAVATGFTFWFVLLIYTFSSVVSCFASAAIMFGVMAIAGYTTKKDLTKFGPILLMGGVGVIAASVINIFIGNNVADIIISIIGVMVFTGLTAFKMQDLKRIGAGLEYGEIPSDQSKRLALMGGMFLFVSFINIFLFLLRLFGGKRN